MDYGVEYWKGNISFETMCEAVGDSMSVEEKELRKNIMDLNIKLNGGIKGMWHPLEISVYNDLCKGVISLEEKNRRLDNSFERSTMAAKEIVDYAKRTLELEGFDVDVELYELGIKYANGEISFDEVMQIRGW